MGIYGILRKTLGRIHHTMTISWYKFAGPPRILKFSPQLNAKMLRAFGASVGENNVIYSPIVIHDALNKRSYANLTIGDNCVLGGNNFLDLSSKLTLKSGCSIGPGVTLMTHNGFNANPFLESRLEDVCGFKAVVLEEGANIKSHSLVAMGVTIGKEAVVAGSSLVNADVPSRHIVSGVPAKIVTGIE